MSKRFVLLEEAFTPDIDKELTAAAQERSIETIYDAAIYYSLIEHPMGLSLSITDGNDKYHVNLSSDLWGNLKICCGSGIKDEYLIQDSLSQGHFILRNIVDLANKGLADLIYASDLVMAQFSKEAPMLESLAGSGDSMVRALVKHNEDSSESAKILAILRDSQPPQN
jgi:hypothetical protein